MAMQVFDPHTRTKQTADVCSMHVCMHPGPLAAGHALLLAHAGCAAGGAKGTHPAQLLRPESCSMSPILAPTVVREIERGWVEREQAMAAANPAQLMADAVCSLTCMLA